MTNEFAWESPDPPAVFTASDLVGEVIIVIKGGYHPAVATKEYGTKPALRATVVLLTGRAAGTVYDDVMLWSKQASQFRDNRDGGASVCRILAKGKSTVFEPASDYDKQMASHWVGKNAHRFEQLRLDAMRNFREAAIQMEQNGQTGSRPDPSPQYTPQSDPDEQTGRHGGVHKTLTEDVESASPQETGY